MSYRDKPYSIPKIKKYFGNNVLGIYDAIKISKLGDGRSSMIFKKACENLSIELATHSAKNTKQSNTITQAQWEAIKAEIKNISNTKGLRKAYHEVMSSNEKNRGYYYMYNYFFEHVKEHEKTLQKKQELINIITSPCDKNDKKYIVNRIFKNHYITYSFLRRVAGSIFKNHTSRQTDKMGKLISVKKNIETMCYMEFSFKNIKFRNIILSEKQLKASLELMKIYQASSKNTEYLALGIRQLEVFFADIDRHCQKYGTEYQDGKTYRSLWI